jgi:hypothetical protein
MLAVETDKKHLCGALARPDVDRNLSILCDDAHVSGCPVLATSLCDRLVHVVAIRADEAARTIHDYFRSIRSIAEALPIAGLAVGRRLQGERVLPTQIIPIGHMEGQRQHVGALLRQVIQVGVSRRAGRAALRCEKLHYEGPFRGRSNRRREPRERPHNKQWPCAHFEPPFVFRGQVRADGSLVTG